MVLFGYFFVALGSGSRLTFELLLRYFEFSGVVDPGLNRRDKRPKTNLWEDL